MNRSRDHWAQLKKEFPSLMYLLIVQTWLNFNFPAFTRLGSPINTLFSIAISIISCVVYLHVFLFPENYAPQLHLQFLDLFPDPAFYKNIFRTGMILVFHFAFLYMWHTDYYGISALWYLILYLHSTISFILMYNAACDCVSTKQHL